MGHPFRFMFGAGTISLVTLLAVLLLRGQSASASPELAPAAQSNASGWTYETAEDNGQLTSRVTYDHATLGQLQAFVTENARQASELRTAGVPNARATITFRQPLPLEEFRAWAAAGGATVTNYTLRVLTPRGERVTVGNSPTSRGKAIEDAGLQRALQRVAEHGATNVRGVITAEADISLAGYTRLASDPKVFLVDVTAAVVKREVGQNPSLAAKPHDVRVSPAFWYLEDLGAVR